VYSVLPMISANFPLILSSSPFFQVFQEVFNSSAEPSNSIPLPLNFTVRPCPRMTQAWTNPITLGRTAGKTSRASVPMVTASPLLPSWSCAQ
ncbi:MAG: hypothetical protein V9E96_07325, partial [Chitinophagaceae bacterium]